MIRILAVDVATSQASVALWQEGEILQQIHRVEKKRAEPIISLLRQLLDKAGVALSQVDAIAFGRGPGSFTGIRVAASAVQGLAFGLDRPVLPVSDLQALAQQMWRKQQTRHVATALDAYQKEIYWGCFAVDDAQVMQSTVAEQVVTASQAAVPSEQAAQYYAVGDGWVPYGAILAARLGCVLSHNPVCYPEAQDIAELGALALAQGEAFAAECALPVYLRDQSAWTKMTGAC